MSTKMESRQFTPSVIARLMGLDELSPHQPVHKKQKVLSENYLRRVASIGVRGKRSPHERHSFRLSAEEQEEFRGAFEVHGKLKREEDCNLGVKKGKSKLSLSATEDVHDAQAVVDSKMDLFMKYLQEPESFILKHHCDLQGIHHHLQSDCLTVLKSSNGSDTGKTDICNISRRESDQESVKLLWKLETGLLTDPHRDHVLGNGYKLLRLQQESVNLTTEIVLLKPKLGKKENATKCFSSSSSCRDSHLINKHPDFCTPEKGNSCVENEERKDMTKNVEPVRWRFRISRQTGQGKNNLFTKASKSVSRDNHSFAEDSELKTSSPPNSCDEKNHQQPSFAHSDGAYAAREVRKEILERWKTTKKFQEVEVASRNRTMREMLATPDQESSAHNSDFRLNGHDYSSQTGLCCNPVTRLPEKWLQYKFRKQEHNVKDGMESQYFPCLESRNGHPVQDDRLLQVDLKRKLEEKDTCEQIPMVLNSSNSYPDSEERCTVQELQKKRLEEKNLSEQSSVVTKSSVNCVASPSMVVNMVTDAQTVDGGQSSENHKGQHMKMTDCMLLVEDGYFSPQVPDAPTQQDMLIRMFKEDSSFGSCTDPECLANLEEVYQPSPNSVLEPPFEKEISSSSLCCQSVDSNLHGLQLQLELLKSESSEAYSEGAGMIVSSDDDSEGDSVSHSGENEELMRVYSVEESRDFSYLVDVFTEAGFHGRNLDMGYEMWHSPEFPISPTVFEMLEKKYGEQMSWKRSERRLLFDCINSKLMEIIKPSVGTHGKKPLSSRLCFGKNFDMIQEELWTLLGHQVKQANRDSSVKVLGKDDGWLDLEDDIEVIAIEMENSFIDQLAEEVVSMERF